MDTIGIIFYYIFLKQFFLNHFKGGRLIKQKFPYLIFMNPREPAKLLYRNKSIFGLFVLFADSLQQITCCPRFFACDILHILCIQYDTLRYPSRQILHKIVKTGRFQQFRHPTFLWIKLATYSCIAIGKIRIKGFTGCAT